MKKILLIGWKDVRLAFRDTAALVLMLIAPFALTLGLGLVTGRFSGSANTGLTDIPVVLVNQDQAQLGEALVALFQAEELAALLEPTVSDDPAEARRQVDTDESAAAIIIPAGFTESIIPGEGVTAPGERVMLSLYTNPSRPTSVGVIRTLVDAFINRVEIGRVSAEVVVTQLVREGLVPLEKAAQVGAEVGAQQAQASSGAVITLNQSGVSGEVAQFDVLAYMAPGMALMFLMYTVANSGRTLLVERTQGTLPRLLVSPTSATQVLGGKVLGLYLTGVAQMLILILASTLIFSLNWGDPLGVLVLVLAAVVGAAGWGLLITALAKTPGQISAIGSAVMLSFGILGGSFFSVDALPRWFALAGKITPNAWGLDGFTTLALGGRLADIGGPVLALLVMGTVLFAAAALILNRRGIAQA